MPGIRSLSKGSGDVSHVQRCTRNQGQRVNQSDDVEYVYVMQQVESMIGTRVPGLSTNEKPKTASELPAAEAPLASRTIRDQVRPLSLPYVTSSKLLIGYQ